MFLNYPVKNIFSLECIILSCIITWHPGVNVWKQLLKYCITFRNSIIRDSKTITQTHINANEKKCEDLGEWKIFCAKTHPIYKDKLLIYSQNFCRNDES